jgi:hypothetical protein
MMTMAESILLPSPPWKVSAVGELASGDPAEAEAAGSNTKAMISAKCFIKSPESLFLVKRI